MHTAVHFATDRADLSDERSCAICAAFLATLPAGAAPDRPGLGHADQRAGDAYNLDLSARRAATVAAALRAIGRRARSRSRLVADGRDDWPRDRWTTSPASPATARSRCWSPGEEVVLPGCPDWSRDPGYDPRNLPLSNLGCANAVNLGLMVADPGDLATRTPTGAGRRHPRGRGDRPLPDRQGQAARCGHHPVIKTLTSPDSSRRGAGAASVPRLRPGRRDAAGHRPGGRRARDPQCLGAQGRHPRGDAPARRAALAAPARGRPRRRRAAAIGGQRAGRGVRARRDRDRDRRPQRCRAVPRPDQQRRQRLSGQADHAGSDSKVAAERRRERHAGTPERSARPAGRRQPARAAASAPRCSRPASPGRSRNRRRRRVALVDLDLQFGTVALALDLEPSPGLREALEHPGRIDAPVRRPRHGPAVRHALRAQRRGVAGRPGRRRHVLARHPAQGAAQQIPLRGGRLPRQVSPATQHVPRVPPTWSW